MRTRLTFLPLFAFLLALASFPKPSLVANTVGCQDSTAVPAHLFGWDHTGDPYGIAVGTNGYVYVADLFNDQICRYSLYGGGGMCWGATGNEDGEFREPRWLSWNPVNNRLYVSEQIGARVQVFDENGNFLFSIENDTLSTDPGKFAGHTGPIAVDPVTGNVYVHERNTLDDVTVDRIQEFGTGGAFTGRVISNGQAFPPPNCGTWFDPWDMVVDSTGSIYVLDNAFSFFPSAVHRLDASGSCVALWGDQQAMPGALTNPSNIAVDRDSFVYVMDHSAAGSQVHKYGRMGDYVSTLQLDLVNEYLALDFLKQGPVTFLYTTRFSAPHRVEVFGDGIETKNILETQWVDQNTFQLITDDLQFLAECPSDSTDKRIEMSGVAADGVSPLLLRLRLPETGTVRWVLSDPDNPGITELLGTLTTLDSSVVGTTIDAQVDSVGEEHIAFAIYTAPIDFQRPSVPSDVSVAERPLRITAEFMPESSSDSVAIAEDLLIERSTVVFLHGYLESPDDWGEFKTIKAGVDTVRWGRERIVEVDYESWNGGRLAANAGRLQTALKSVTSSARRRLVASAQVDIISHSMGGLVLRRLADATPQDLFTFRNTANMGQGYYHKALFLNVPHQGSPLANITVTIRGIMTSPLYPQERRLSALAILTAHAKMSGARFNQLIGGAIDDMSLGSDAVTNLQPFTVPTHGHVGTGGSDLWFTRRLLDALVKRSAAAYIGLVTSFTNIPEVLLYVANVHDMAVLLDSQIGGLSDPGHYITAGFEDGLHESSFFSVISGSRARDWATRSAGDASFFASSIPGGGAAAMPSPEVEAWVSNVTQTVQDEMPDFAGVTARITEPRPGWIVLSGDSFLIEVEPFSDVSSVVVTYPGGAVFMDSTLSGYAPTPVEHNGSFEMTALVLMADGTMGRSEPVTITVRPRLSVTLDGIEVTPSAASLPGIGSLISLRVVGNYSDGVRRNIASSQSGTVYSGFDPSVVSVSDDGVLRGSGPGTTAITVNNSSFTRVVNIEVGDAPPINNPPQAVAGGPYQICNGDGVNLDASQSFDSDNDALTLEWDVNGDGVFGDLVGATVSYSPPYTVSERLIALRVTDPSGATSEDITSIQIPLSCFEGTFVCARDVIAYEASDVGTDAIGDIYTFNRFDDTGTVRKVDGSCAPGDGSTVIFDPEDLDELAVDSAGVAYVIGSPSDERIMRFGEGFIGSLTPLIPIFTTPYSLVTGVAVDRDGNVYGSDWDEGAQQAYLRKFDQSSPVANLIASWNLTLDAGIVTAESLSVAVAADSAIYIGARNEVLKGVPQGGGYVLERRWGSEGLGAGQFRGVSDVAVAPDGDVFVADYGNHRIQRFTSDGTFRSMRKGTDAFDGNFYRPTAVIAVDSACVAVTDFYIQGDPRVQLFVWGDPAPTAVPPQPEKYNDALVQNYPNPFNPTTTIAFSIAEAGHAVVTIYDVRGALVRTLVDGPRSVGTQRVVWDGKNDFGVSVSSGVYFYRLTAGRFSATKKMVLLR